MGQITWPNSRDYAFTVVDDTDGATVENIRPLYRLLKSLGIRITKTVWPLRSDPEDRCYSQSLQDPEYLDFILELQADGFEIGYHGARAGSNQRSVIQEALDVFREKLGHDPYTYAQHADSVENVYWGRSRTSLPVVRSFAAACSRHRGFLGDQENSPYFWGDLCKERIRYVRNYGLPGTDVLSSDPWTPYRDPSKPYVNNWFSSVGIPLTNESLDEHHYEGLVRSWQRRNSLVIAMTHFAYGAVVDGKVTGGVEQHFRRLSKSNGWFAPAVEILDYILKQRGEHVLTSKQARFLERRWAINMGKKVVLRRIRSMGRRIALWEK